MDVPSGPGAQVPVTLRVPADVKDRVAAIATEMGISQSAVWKILIAAHLRPALRSGEFIRTIAQAGGPPPPSPRSGPPSPHVRS